MFGKVLKGWKDFSLCVFSNLIIQQYLQQRSCDVGGFLVKVSESAKEATKFEGGVPKWERENERKKEREKKR